MHTCKHHRLPPDIICYAVCLYYRFNLSHQDIEELLAQRGITVSREAIRLWYPTKIGTLGEAFASLMGQDQEQEDRPIDQLHWYEWAAPSGGAWSRKAA